MEVLNQKSTIQSIGIGIVINNLLEVLIDKRRKEGHMGGFWEFPGGKKRFDENIEMTIARELKEELSIEVDVGKHLITFNHSYGNKRMRFSVYLCHLVSGEPKPLASQQVRWVHLSELGEFNFPDANEKMIVALQEHYSKNHLSKIH